MAALTVDTDAEGLTFRLGEGRTLGSEEQIWAGIIWSLGQVGLVFPGTEPFEDRLFYVAQQEQQKARAVQAARRR